MVPCQLMYVLASHVSWCPSKGNMSVSVHPMVVRPRVTCQ